ncbi:MAG: hypothetical protein L0H63_12445 [Nitrococcus sp.]|nr:hypothetical protein [Nitrococcus sp.]
MKGMLMVITALVFGIAASTETSAKKSEPQLPLNQVVEPGVAKTFGHQRSVVMVEGFWAKAGSDVTVSIDELANTLIQMAAPVPIPTDISIRVPATGADMTGSPGTGSKVVEIGDGVSLPNPAGYYAVTSIGIQEKGNNPCLLTLWGRMVDPAFESADRKLAQFELEKCRSFPFSTMVDFKQAQLPKSSDTFVRGVLACGGHTGILPQGAYSSLSWEIKGLKVHGGRVVPETDEVEPMDKVSEFTRANCIKDEAGAYGPGWTVWHECPIGELMTGVRLYRYEDKWFTGMSAICKIPQRSVPPRKPVKDPVGI